MNTSKARSLFLASSMLALCGAAAPAAAEPSAAGATVQEIVVTAQRQAQSLLSVPMSISASTGEQLDKAGIKDLSQLQFTTPGYLPSYTSGFTEIYIRGIGNNILVGASPSVATFIDDVPRPYGQMVENFIDVDRVEVLKGAQGGLYGRNATAGVVNIITRQPSTDSFHASAKVSYGEKSTFQAAAYANMPINDKMALSVAVERDTHDPYVKNIASPAPYTAAMFPNGAFHVGAGGAIVPLDPAQAASFFNSGVHVQKGLANQDLWAVNTKLLIKPTDNFKVTLAGDFSRKRDTNGNQIFSSTPGYLQAATTGMFASFGIDAQLPASLFRTTDGKFTAAKGMESYTRLRDYGGSATAVWSLPHVELTSITAQRFQQSDWSDDFAPAPVPMVDGVIQIRRWFLYQELRAISTDTGRFHYLAGATYLSDNFRSTNYTALLAPLVAAPVTHVVTPVRNWSIYGQVGYDITPALNLTISGRYVHETNTARFSSPVVSAASLKETKFLPSATLSYKLDGGGNVYARWAKGFKSGGVNPIAPPVVFEPNINQGSVFAPETVDTYEVGYRAALFNRRVQLTTAAFYNDYKNLQSAAHSNAQHPEIVIAMVNAGSARTYGFEESLTWRVTPAVTLGANAGYLNAKYKTFAVANSPILLPFDVSGATMPNSPKWQLSFSGDLDQPLNDKFRLVGNVLVSHLSSVIYLQSALPGVLPEPGQPGYWLANARVGVRTTDDRYGLSVFANNLFNKGYVTFGASSALGNQLTWGAPRIIGAEVSAKW